MRVTEVTDVKDDAQTRRWAPVLWPWVLVVAAWTIAGLSVLTNQSSLINHLCWLLRASVRNHRHGVLD